MGPSLVVRQVSWLGNLIELPIYLFNIESSRRPCRFHIDIEGLDWHLYNRTAAFDEIIRKMAHSDRVNGDVLETHLKKPELKSFPSRITINTSATPRVVTSLFGSFNEALREFRSQMARRLGGFIPSLEFTDILPVSFEISAGNVTCGNPSTRALLIGHCRKVVGDYTVINVSPNRPSPAILSYISDRAHHPSTFTDRFSP
jgi:hypothetical protein